MAKEDAISKRCPACRAELPKGVSKCGYCGRTPWYWQEHQLIWLAVMAVLVVGYFVVSAMMNNDGAKGLHSSDGFTQNQ